MDEKADNLQIGGLFGHYRILKKLGAGGMGEVYLAEDASLERLVALKVLLPEIAGGGDERVRRFVLEAKAASALNHPNILTIFEFGASGETYFLASEFIKGETLRDTLNQNNLILSETLDIAIQIASALAAAHDAGIVHRDIKPENVMIREDGYIKVLDFGLAKLVERAPLEAEAETRMQAQTQAGMIMGTVAYMSPEQARGKAVDPRTDIFSLGVVLYEMLTLQQPFTGETVNHIVVAILEKEPPPVSQFIQNAPAELERIIQKALAKNADARYTSAKDLLADLKTLQKRQEFEAELERSQALNKQPEADTQIFKVEADKEIENLPPNNLTENFASIIGREKEIAEIKNLLLQNEVRLLTMTGIGGTGKTTLAQAVARGLLTEFSDGVFFVELAAITNAELVISTIALPLGVKEAGGKPTLEILKDYLRDKRMLIVVDNFEQVIDAAPKIAELLSAASKLKILITSRVPLHLSAEREFVVPPLAVPDEISQISLDELLNYEAIKLFVERARNAKSNFALREENARSIAEICARLEGLPLAIELAAARVKILSPQMILTKLENRLKLLTGGASDLPARQQTMRGAVEWSYDLLNEDEKTLFRLLAVFAGGFTFEAAEAIVQSSSVLSPRFSAPASLEEKLKFEVKTPHEGGTQNPDVLELITSLVDKSLLVAKEQADGESRFRMLEVVREYALNHLEVSDEAEAMRHNHATYFLALAEEAEPHLQGAQLAKWLNCLEEEHDNLREALRWSLAYNAVTAARLAAAIRYFWVFQGYLTEGFKWSEEILKLGDGVPTAARWKILSMAGNMARYQGDYETARRMYEEGLTQGLAADDLPQISLSCRGLGGLALEQGDYTTARRFSEEALSIARKSNDKYGIARSLSMLGDLARTVGDDERARPLFEEALTICRQLDNKYAIGNILTNLAAAEYGLGDYTAANSHFAEALTMSQKLGGKILGDKISISYILDGFAALAVQRGESEMAARLAGATEQLRESINYNIEPAERRFRAVYLAELKTKMDAAAFAKLYEQGHKMKLEEVVALCLEKTGDDELQREVESLLSSFDSANSFLQKPAVGEVADVVVGTNNHLPEGQRISHYEIIRQIGAGGMGEVYLAKDINLNRKVALKLLSAHITEDKDRVNHFRQEAFATSALNHPNIVTIHEIGKWSGRDFIATEFIEGMTLRSVLGKKKLAISEALDIALQIASALAAAHGAGIIHRDIKPENIMIREDGLVKVLDFGIAKYRPTEEGREALVETAVGEIIGTAAYMSPEQARGLEIDARTDIWSLGVILYEMIARKLPFIGKTKSDRIAAILERDPAPLSKTRRDIPPELEQIVSRALAKEKKERYSEIAKMAEDLHRLREKTGGKTGD